MKRAGGGRRPGADGGDRKRARRRRRTEAAPSGDVQFDGDGLEGSPVQEDGFSGGRPSAGKILFYDRQKGYGFIMCDSEKQDVFFPRGALQKELQEKHADDLRNMEVAFDLYTKEDGKPRAERVVPLGSASPLPDELPIATGQIVRFDEVKGFGFIQPDDSRGEDTFFLRQELPRELQGQGQQILDTRVEFEVVRMPDGKFRAKRIALLPGSVPLPPHAPAQRGGSAGPGGTFFGRILRFDRAKGYGFVACPGQVDDVFFLSSALPRELADALNRGDSILDAEVLAEVVINEEGKPRAADLRLAGQPVPGPPPPMPSMPRDGPKPGQGRGPGLIGDTGVICSFDPAKGFGFIKPDGPGDDIFVLRSEMPPEIREAQTREEVIDRRVEFEVVAMPDGKLRGLRLALLPPPGQIPPQGGPNKRLIGRVRKFDRLKGFGFITVPGESEDVFFLPSALPKEVREGPGSLDGMDVSFDFHLNEEGKPRGTNLMPLGRPGFMPAMQYMGPMGPMGMPMGPPHMPPMMGPPPHLSGMGPAMGPPPMGPMPPGAGTMPPMGSGPPGPMPMGPPPMGPPPMGPPGSLRRDVAGPSSEAGGVRVCSGVIRSFESNKGFGFIIPDGINEDVFYLRSEMPPELRECQHKDQVINKRVEFEIRFMPDGRLRARRMVLFPPPGNSPAPVEERRTLSAKGAKNIVRVGDERDPPHGGRGAEDDSDDASRRLPSLDGSLVEEMSEFLAESGGGCDYGKFSSRFPKVKKKQLEKHFEIFSLDRGVQRIELPGEEAGRQASGELGGDGSPLLEPTAEETEMCEDVGSEETGAGEAGNEDDVPLDPAIPLGPGCRPRGTIRTYDAVKGSGFIHVEGLDEEVFFQRSALPENFQTSGSELPNLGGVDVSFEMSPSWDKRQRAEHIDLLLKWHVEDKCWLLLRS